MDELEASGKVDFQVWDLNKPAPAGLTDLGLVLAHNTLHEALDISSTLAHIYSALQDGGFLCFYEETGPIPALLWGMEDATWQFTDSREYGPCLSVSHWMEQLQAAGLPPVLVHACPTGSSALFLCRKLEKQPPRVPLQAPPLDLSEQDAEAWLEECKKKMRDVAAAKQTLVLQGSQDSSSGLLGFARCLAKEEGGDSVRCVFNATPSVKPQKNPAEGFDMFLVVYKDGRAGTLRCKTTDLEVTAPLDKLSAGAHLSLPIATDLNTLQWLENSPRRPADQVHCAVAFAALNAADVLLMQGKLPPDVTQGSLIRNLGFEFSGITAEGQRVMGLTSEAIASSCFASAHHLWEVPSAWSLEEAASVPVAYSTAYYTLLTCARVLPGQTVLVHGGCDPVGSAVIEVALARGCEVMTTVHSEERAR